MPGALVSLVVFSTMVAMALTRSLQSSVLRRRIRRGQGGRQQYDDRVFFAALVFAAVAIAAVSSALLV
jgi:hypothetical protein